MGRLVYVLRTFPEISETFVRTEIRALRRRGVPVSVMTAISSSPPAADWTPEDERDVPVIRLDGHATALGIARRTLVATGVPLPALRKRLRVGRLEALAESAAELLPEDTTLLHAHFANDAAVLARHLAEIAGIPYRVTAHAYDIFQDPLLLEANLKDAALAMTVSEANAQHLRAQFPSVRAIEVVRCGVDLRELAYKDPEPPNGPARLLCVGRLVEKKGHSVLLDAVAALRAEGVELELTCLGTGPLAGSLAARASRPDLAGVVKLVGAAPPSEVRGAMRRADAVVLPSRVAADGDRDGIPVALMEAMALGVPVVTTAAPGIDELVGDTAGPLARQGDYRSLAESIRESIARAPGERLARARAARGRIELAFDIDKIAERLIPSSPTAPSGSRTPPVP